NVGQLLHDGVVDGVRWAICKCSRVDADEVDVRAGCTHGCGAGSVHCRVEISPGREPYTRPHHKEATVAEVLPAIDMMLGGANVRFFHKAVQHIATVGCLLALAQISIAGLRSTGSDTESHHCATAGRRIPLKNCSVKL